MLFTRACWLVVATVVGLAAGAALPEATTLLERRSSPITFTVINKCKHSFTPIFQPALPGRETWPELKHGKSSSHTFRSDTYKGLVFSPLRSADRLTGKGATVGEVDLSTGSYDINLTGGYNVPLFLWSQGRQSNGYCTPARCDGPQCADAYKAESGLLTSQRDGLETVIPNHSCPPTFGNWVVQFC